MIAKLDFIQLLESSLCFIQNENSIYKNILAGQEIKGQAVPGTDLHWAPGAADGAYILHFKVDDDHIRAAEAFDLFDTCIQNTTTSSINNFYNYFFENTLIHYEAPLRHLLSQKPDLTDKQEREYVEKANLLGQWLIEFSPDREQTKAGILLLSVFLANLQESLKLVKTIARNDEFTFYALPALYSLCNKSDMDYENELVDLAHSVEGWGRVFIIYELLKMPLKASTKNWLLREGYKNKVLYVYTAYSCAVAGDLLEELKMPQPDEKLLIGASEILSALFEEGPPVKNIIYLPNGAAIAWLFLQHVSQRHLTTQYIQTIKDIHDFLHAERTDAEEQQIFQQNGWTPYFCDKIKDLIQTILSNLNK